jgi:lipoyl(octanoyl) transferase
MSSLNIRHLGLIEYKTVFEKMRYFTYQRDSTTEDELWCLQHPSVFTLGANADQRHILRQSDIPIVQTDRGGQITYHGPGQIIIYLLIDLKRKSMGVKKLVQSIEQATVTLLEEFGICAQAKADAHGVYVNHEKIASLGLRVHRGYSYHGLALNVDMDLQPFRLINPCGFAGLKITQMSDHTIGIDMIHVSTRLIEYLYQTLKYDINEITFYDE